MQEFGQASTSHESMMAVINSCFVSVRSKLGHTHHKIIEGRRKGHMK